jgi:hypothetical protein
MRILASATALVTLALMGCGDGVPSPAGHPANMDKVAPVLSAQALEAFSPKVGELLYVPAYSSIYNATAHGKLLLTIVLSVRNTDPDNAVVLRSARYYDTAGNLLTETVPAPRLLPPLATYEYVVDLTDDSGGSGANFLVEWEADTAVAAEPLVETVNIETLSGHGISFTSRAVVVKSLAGAAEAKRAVPEVKAAAPARN